MKTSKVEGEKLLQAWSESTPKFDRDRGRERFLAALPRQRLERSRRSVVWMAAAAAVFVCALGASWMRWSAPLTFTQSNQVGEVNAWLATGATSELPLSFSEGTSVVLGHDSRGRVEHLDRSGAHFVLERGAVHASVVHRSGTDWRFRAGPFEVLVTGTELNVAWDPATEEFTLAVESGSVVVHGPYVGSDQRVRSGERCLVDLATKSMNLTTGDVGSALPTASADVSAPPPMTSSSSSSPNTKQHIAPPFPANPSWSTLEEHGEYDDAYAAADHAGFSTLFAKSSADELLRLSEVGHLSGHGDVERNALLACRRRFPSTPEAALAAYKLGRGSAPGEAIVWFSAYIQELPAGSLAREAEGRLMEAQSLAGNQAAAAEEAKRYLIRYPDGPHASLARRLLAGVKDE